MSEEIEKHEARKSEPEKAKVEDSESLISDKKDSEIEAATEKRTEENTAVILKEKRELSEPMTESEAKKNMSRRSRRTFLIGGATALAGIFGWRWMPADTKNSLLSRAFRFNENVSQKFFGSNDLAPEFSRDLAGDRVNGMIGLENQLDAAAWRLNVGGLANRTDDLILTLDDIKSLPRVEMTTELKCIEGWSIVVNWVGARFSDFAQKFAPPADTQYVSLATPDQGYYVGWDMASILHPQTLLAYEMNGQSLTVEHGAPLRLATTTKYGIKQIKRIGRIEFTDERPRDYWAEQGYDWYSGH